MPTFDTKRAAQSREFPSWQEAFPGELRSVSDARTHARRQAAAWGYEVEVAETVALVITELASNAVRYGCTAAGSVFQAGLVPGPEGLAVHVSDAGRHFPSPAVVEDEDEHGRGLLVVNACSLRWGVTVDPLVGKQTWSLIGADLPAELRRQNTDQRRRSTSPPSSADRSSVLGTSSGHAGHLTGRAPRPPATHSRP